MFAQKAFLVGLFLVGLIFGGAYYWKEFCILKWVGLDNKNSLKHYENSLKQLKTASTNSPWAYIRKGLLSEGFLRLRFGGLIFGRAYFFGGGLIIGILRYFTTTCEYCHFSLLRLLGSFGRAYLTVMSQGIGVVSSVCIRRLMAD